MRPGYTYIGATRAAQFFVLVALKLFSINRFFVHVLCVWYLAGVCIQQLRYNNSKLLKSDRTYTVMGARGSGRFNPYNTSESLLFYTLDTSSGFWMTNIIHSPMKLSYFSRFALVFMYVMTLITLCMFSNMVSPSFTLKVSIQIP